MVDEDGSNVIGGTRFSLKVCGKTICPQSFLLLFGISYAKLVNLVTDITSIPVEDADDSDSLDEVPTDNIYQQDRIRAFLKLLFDSDIYSEPMVGYPESFRRITLFSSREVFVDIIFISFVNIFNLFYRTFTTFFASVMKTELTEILKNLSLLTMHPLFLRIGL
jgi:hypothetical protein